MSIQSLAVRIEGDLIRVVPSDQIISGGGGGATDHGALTGLADDDHPQYLLAAGAAELIRDTIGAALVAGTNITLTVNDAGDTITITGPDLSSYLTSSAAPELIRDTIGTALVAGTGMTVTVNDAGDTITAAIDTTAEAERIRDVIGTALVAGANITLTVNDAGDTITIAESGGGGGSVATDVIFDAKGDIPAGTAADTAAKVTVGTEGHQLTATPSASTGLAYAGRTIRLAKPDSTYVHLSHPVVTGARAASLDRLVYVPIDVLPDHPYTNFGISVSAADTGGSGVLRIGLYQWLPTGLPGALIIDGGTVPTTTTGIKFVGISRTPRTNMLFVGYAFQGSVTSLTGAAGGNSAWPSSNGLYLASNREPQGCYYEESITGALPSTPGSIAMSAHNSNTNHVIYAY